MFRSIMEQISKCIFNEESLMYASSYFMILNHSF